MSNELAKAGGGLTAEQAALIEALSGDGVPADQELMQTAGYDNAQKLGSALASPAVVAELKTRRKSRIGTTLAAKALRAMEQLIESDKTPAATRFSAARWMLEQAGHGSQVDDGRDKPLHEMSEAELLAFMEKAQRVVEAGGSPPIITVTPGDGA